MEKAKVHCRVCGDRGWVQICRTTKETEEFARKHGTIMAGWLAIHDIAFPWKPCERCCLIYRQFRDTWE